jgi:hypothetical protein
MQDTHENDSLKAALTACLASIDRLADQRKDQLVIISSGKRKGQKKDLSTAVDPFGLGAPMPWGSLTDPNRSFAAIVSWFEENARQMSKAESKAANHPLRIAKNVLALAMGRLKWLADPENGQAPKVEEVFLAALIAGFSIALDGATPQLEKAVQDSLKKQSGGVNTGTGRRNKRHDIVALRDLILKNFAVDAVPYAREVLFQDIYAASKDFATESSKSTHLHTVASSDRPRKGIPMTTIYKTILQDYCVVLFSCLSSENLDEDERRLFASAKTQLENGKPIRMTDAENIFSFDRFKALVAKHPELADACRGRLTHFPDEAVKPHSPSDRAGFRLRDQG